MGGAERAERRRKQQAALAASGKKPATQAGKAVRAARGGGSNRSVVAGVGIVVLVALVVGIGVWLQSRNEPGDLPAAIPTVQPAAQYDVQRDDTAVVTGRGDAPVTIEIYEDFLCPACGEFEHAYREQLAHAASDGSAKVIYHPVAILDELSEPQGYSTMAAGAALCAADADIYPAFHDSLYANQPVERGPAWTRPQLQQLGRDLGAGDEFARCVRNDDGRVAEATSRAAARISEMRSDGGFGTPTVLVNGQLADTGNPNWLTEALAQAAR